MAITKKLKLNKSDDKKQLGIKTKMAITSLVIILLAALGTLVVLQYNRIQDLRDPAASSQKEAEQLKKKVSKLILLPEEEMTVATVQDKEALSSQAFFKKAENGDKVLIFADNKTAIIYREKSNLIINAGPIILSENLQPGSKDVEKNK